MLWESVKLALRTIRRNVLRTILTLLGIVIGVAAVIALVTIGQGATDKVTTDLAKLGSNMLIVRPGAPTQGPPGGSDARTFSERDVDSLRAIQGIRAMAPSSNKGMTVVFDGASTETTITGTEPGFFAVQDWSFTEGGPFSDSDMRSGAGVCVVGETIRKDLFTSASPIGSIVRIGSMPCEVVGVLASKGQSAFGSDQDSIIIMPLRSFQRRIAGNTRIATIAISANAASDLAPVQAAITDVLRETRRISANQTDDFTVRDMTQMVAMFSSTTAVMTGLLSAVAAVSLLVGGIGIMNIMLVSVAERTREIGIRLAIGARASQVLTQFLVEAIVLCLIGGVIGIAAGLGLALLASVLLAIPFIINASIMLVAFLFSGLIGLIFGFFPARSAARLDPIDALRHE
jgi:putative ABC transport system permease protein